MQKIKQAECERDQIRSELTQARSEIAALEQRFSDQATLARTSFSHVLSETETRLAETIRGLQSELDAERERTRAEQTHTQEAEARVELLRRELDSAQHTATDIQTQLRTHNTQLQSELHAAQSTISALQVELIAARSECHRANESAAGAQRLSVASGAPQAAEEQVSRLQGQMHIVQTQYEGTHCTGTCVFVFVAAVACLACFLLYIIRVFGCCTEALSFV